MTLKYKAKHLYILLSVSLSAAANFAAHGYSDFVLKKTDDGGQIGIYFGSIWQGYYADIFNRSSIARKCKFDCHTCLHHETRVVEIKPRSAIQLIGSIGFTPTTCNVDCNGVEPVILKSYGYALDGEILAHRVDKK